MRKETMERVVDLWQKKQEAVDVVKRIENKINYLSHECMLSEKKLHKDFANTVIVKFRLHPGHCEIVRRCMISVLEECKDSHIIAELFESFYDIAKNREDSIRKEIDLFYVPAEHDGDLVHENDYLQEEKERLKKRNLWQRIFNK